MATRILYDLPSAVRCAGANIYCYINSLKRTHTYSNLTFIYSTLNIRTYTLKNMLALTESEKGKENLHEYFVIPYEYIYQSKKLFFFYFCPDARVHTDTL